jgi:hypothetical protein
LIDIAPEVYLQRNATGATPLQGIRELYENFWIWALEGFEPLIKKLLISWIAASPAAPRNDTAENLRGPRIRDT